MKKKVCKSCQVFVDGAVCPLCKKSQFSNNWQGRVYIFDTSSSIIAEKMDLTHKGEYTIKVK